MATQKVFVVLVLVTAIALRMLIGKNVVPLVDAKACKRFGATCSSNNDCCSRKCLLNGFCGKAARTASCKQFGAPCSGHGDCCSKRCLLNGFCGKSIVQCKRFGMKCYSDSQCCSKRCNPSGLCGKSSQPPYNPVPVPSCMKEGEACDANTKIKCCGGTECGGGTCHRCSSQEGASCSGNFDCCDGLGCSSSGKCTAQCSSEPGDFCSATGAKCCSPFLCKNYHCCTSMGESCTPGDYTAGGCCPQYNCDPLRKVCCYRAGTICTGDVNCCDNMKCKTGKDPQGYAKCCHDTIGSPCKTSHDCCAGLKCSSIIHGKCVPY